MLLGKPLAVFIERSPVSVMVSATLERVFEPAVLDQVFQEHAVLGYAKELAFSQCVQIMCDVVFKESPSVGAFYQAHPDEIPVTRQAVYDKLKRLESQVPAALVHYSGEELGPCMKAMRSQALPLLPRYRVRVLDGNHLTGTEHRIFELRRFRSAALPGQALVFYDPQYGLITDVVPCEDAHAQERSLLKEALACISARLHFGGPQLLHQRVFVWYSSPGGFLYYPSARLHALLRIEGKTPFGGPGWSGTKHLRTSDLPDRPRKRRELYCPPNYDRPGQAQQGRGNGIAHSHQLGEESGHAVRIAELYADRWTIETGFQQLTDDLRCEINTLGYPKAALFGFCTACMAYNAVSVVKCAIRAAQGKKYVEEELSMYYLTLEVAQVTAGMMIAIPEQDWGVFRRMSPKKFATVLIDLAQRIDPRKYTKHKRGPKTKQPKKTSGKRIHHVSTARILAMRT